MPDAHGHVTGSCRTRLGRGAAMRTGRGIPIIAGGFTGTCNARGCAFCARLADWKGPHVAEGRVHVPSRGTRLRVQLKSASIGRVVARREKLRIPAPSSPLGASERTLGLHASSSTYTILIFPFPCIVICAHLLCAKRPSKPPGARVGEQTPCR